MLAYNNCFESEMVSHTHNSNSLQAEQRTLKEVQGNQVKSIKIPNK